MGAPFLKSCMASFPGDILLSINSVDLTQLSYTEAVSVLKAQAAHAQVELRALHTIAENADAEGGDAGSDDEMETPENAHEDNLNWTPPWTSWLGLPRYRPPRPPQTSPPMPCPSARLKGVPVYT